MGTKKGKEPKYHKRIYLEEEKIELKVNILHILKESPETSKQELKKLLDSTRWQVDHIISECHKEGLIMRIGGGRKVLTRRGHEYLDNNY